MPSEDVPEDVLDGEEYPDGKINPFLNLYHKQFFILFFLLSIVYFLGDDVLETEDTLCPELTMEELKAAFRYSWFHFKHLKRTIQDF